MNFRIFSTSKCERPNHLLNVTCQSVLRLFNVSVAFGAQNAKNSCLQFAIFNISEKLQNIFEIGLKKYGEFRTEIGLIEKMFRKKKFADKFLYVVYVLTYPLSKFGGNQTNFLRVLAFYN